MALKIRLARGGSKKRPFYQIVIADARSPRDGRFLEKVGSWNPMLKKDDAKRVELNNERISLLDVERRPADRPRPALPQRSRHRDPRSPRQPDQGTAGQEGAGAYR